MATSSSIYPCEVNTCLLATVELMLRCVTTVGLVGSNDLHLAMSVDACLMCAAQEDTVSFH